MNIDSILQQLKSERDRIDTAIRALEGSGTGSEPKRRGRKPNALKQAEASSANTSSAKSSSTASGSRKRRVLSAEARKRMSEAAKRRWAERGRGK
jgi:hypothetical protein